MITLVILLVGYKTFALDSQLDQNVQSSVAPSAAPVPQNNSNSEDEGWGEAKADGGFSLERNAEEDTQTTQEENGKTGQNDTHSHHHDDAWNDQLNLYKPYRNTEATADSSEDDDTEKNNGSENDGSESDDSENEGSEDEVKETKLRKTMDPKVDDSKSEDSYLRKMGRKMYLILARIDVFGIIFGPKEEKETEKNIATATTDVPKLQGGDGAEGEDDESEGEENATTTSTTTETTTTTDVPKLRNQQGGDGAEGEEDEPATRNLSPEIHSTKKAKTDEIANTERDLIDLYLDVLGGAVREY